MPRRSTPADRQGQTTEPVSFSPGPWPGGSGITEASRKASCSDFSPSRRGAACWLPRSGAAAVTRPARALISRRASSRSRWSRGVRPLGQAALDRGGAHQVHGGGRDHLDGGHLGDVAGLLRAGGGVLRGIGCLGVHAGSLSDRPAVSSIRPDLVGVSGRAQRAREAEQQPLPPASTARDHVTSPSPGPRSARLAVPQPPGATPRSGSCTPHDITRRACGPDWLGSPAPRAPTVTRGLSSSPGRSRDGQPRRPHQRASHQRPHPGPGSAVGWPQW